MSPTVISGIFLFVMLGGYLLIAQVGRAKGRGWLARNLVAAIGATALGLVFLGAWWALGAMLSGSNGEEALSQQQQTARAVDEAPPGTFEVDEALVERTRPWAPTHLMPEDGTLYVVIPQQRMTQRIYDAVVRTGVCRAFVLDEAEGATIERIAVLNASAGAGLVFDGAVAECEEMLSLDGQQSRRYLQERSTRY